MSRFYGFPVFDLPGGVKLALEGNRPILEAEDELRAGVSDDRLYDLVLYVTGSEEAASAAYQARIAERLRRGEQTGTQQ